MASIGPEGGFRGDNLKTYGGPTPDNLLLRPGDVYVSLKDVTQAGRLLGSVARVPRHIPLGRLTQDTVKLTFKLGAPSADYLYWLLRTPEYREYCKERATGTTNLGLSRLDFLAFAVPPLTKARAYICELLNAFDDKVDLNCRVAETLEAMAQALFRSWFVDFDPVRAKAEGRPTGLPDDVAALFPDAFNYAGLPEGWSMQPFSDLYEIYGGNTPRTENPAFWDGPHQWATPKDLSNLVSPVLLQTNRRLTDAGLRQTSSELLPPGSLLLSTRAPIGYMAFITQPTAINQGFAGIVGKRASPVYAWAWCHANIDVIVGNAGGSTFPEISKAVLRQLPVLSPPQCVLGAFDSITDGFVDRLVNAAKEARTLAGFRDTLLVKLISGELRIADAEKRIAAA